MPNLPEDMIHKFFLKEMRRVCNVLEAYIEHRRRFPILRVPWTFPVLENDEESGARNEGGPALLYDVNGEVTLQVEDDIPDDTALSWEEWNAKVERVLRDCREER